MKVIHVRKEKKQKKHRSATAREWSPPRPAHLVLLVRRCANFHVWYGDLETCPACGGGTLSLAKRAKRFR